VRPRSLSVVAAAVEGDLRGDDATVTSVATDSRQVVPGALFVAIVGERRDGHAFVQDAFDRGAAGALVRRGFGATGPAVGVGSTGDALLRLAGDERASSAATVVGITGANGKTSAKDMTAAVVAERFRTHASPGSFNNEIGAPITISCRINIQSMRQMRPST
jgi:UDP-N-acetylmuramoyl-tripeptide--D-alanyl-D-alanine ligase